MACNCKHNQEAIDDFYKMIQKFKEMFVKRMTVDSETQDRRRKDFNQAIFHFRENEDVDYWNKVCEEFGLPKTQYGKTYAVYSEIELDDVLQCFDDAVKDYRRSFCDVDGCNRK